LPIFPEISSKSVRKFLRKVANKQTDRQTDKQRPLGLHILQSAEVMVNKSLLSLYFY